MKTPRITVVTAGLSEPSSTALLGEQLADATVQALGKMGVQPEVETINVRSIATDITNHFLMGFPAGKLPEALDSVYASDALIVVSPTFKASYTGLFKSFWDLVEDGSLQGKAVLLAATGGTSRHSLMIDTAMRPLFTYLKAQVAPSGVFAATDDFGSDANLQPRIDKATAEFAQIIGWLGILPTHDRPQQASLGVYPTSATEAIEESERAAAISDGAPSGSEFDDADGANSGSFFGIAKERKAPGLEPLKVIPFAQLLNNNKGN